MIRSGGGGDMHRFDAWTLATAPPYDVTIIAEGYETITHFCGVHHTTPVLSFVRQIHGTLRSATVQGNVTDGHVFRVIGGGRMATVPDLSTRGVVMTPGTECDWTPGWASYTIDEYVQGPAAVAALPVVRTSRGVGRVFLF
jgi:hypothetical protein